MKKLLIVGGVLVALLAITVVVVYGQLGSIIKRGIETAGPPITGTPVHLSSARVSIFSGEGALRGLRIGNPKGFSDADAFDLSHIALAIDPKSVTAAVIHVRSIVIDGPLLLAEFDAAGHSNLDAILAHVKGAAGSGGGGGKSGGPEPRLIVDEFRFVNAQVRAQAPAYQLDKVVPLPAVELKNIGAHQGGVTPSQLASEVMKPIISAAAQTAANEYLKAQGGRLGDKLLDRFFKK